MSTRLLAAAFAVPALLATCSGVSEQPAAEKLAEAAPPAAAEPTPAPATPAQPEPTAVKPAAANPTEAAAAANLYALEVRTLAGQPKKLADYRGDVVLVVNTASHCGYTPQYEGLEKLHRELAPKGFEVLGFPSNDFGRQEPGSATEIQEFCTSRYDVTFPLFEKVVTQAGAEQAPVYAYLGGATGKLPNWNFCKYLVGKDGAVIAFYPSKIAPDDAELRRAIDAALSAP
jgi:glutathione peroxidase